MSKELSLLETGKLLEAAQKIVLCTHVSPDGDTLGRFRNILLKNGIQQELFAQVVEFLTQRGLILKRGTIVDSTFIEAPSSTKNQKKERDPEAHSAKKGNVWYFWYKAHIGVDSESGLVHTVQVTAANVHDVCVTADLLTGEEEQVYRRVKSLRKRE